MKVDGGFGQPARRGHRRPQAKELEDAGYDGAVTAETATTRSSRSLLAAEHTERLELGTGDRGRVRPHPDDAGEHRATTCRRTRRAGSSSASAARSSRTSRSGSRCRGRTRRARMREFILAMRAIWASLERRRRKLDFRRRVLPPHADDAVLQPGPEPVRHAEGVPRRGRRADDRGRGRGGRRHHHARLHHRALRARGHDARRSSAAWRRRAGRAPTSRSRVRCSSSPARPTRRWRRRAHGHASSRSRSTARRPRTAACSSCTAGAICRPSSTALSKQGEWVEMGELIDDEMLDDVRGRRRARAASAASSCAPLRRRRRPAARSTRPYQSDPERWSRILAGFHAAA